jgi:integrase
MRWSEIDFTSCDWMFIVSKTKTEHVVPLADQAVRLLKALQPFTNDSPYVFPNGRSKTEPMSENAVLAALRRLGIKKEEASGHGFRASFRTIGDEILGERVDLLEHQLAHQVRDPLGRAYNRTAHLPERRRMMQRWADYLDSLRATTTPSGSSA